MNFLQSMTTANFWSNDFLSGLAFTAGAMLSSAVYSGAGLINNYFSIGSALFASLTIPIIIPLLLMFVLKFVGAAITRLVLNTAYKRDFENE